MFLSSLSLQRNDIFPLALAFGVSFLCFTYFIISFFGLQDGILYNINNFHLYITEKSANCNNSLLTFLPVFVILNMLGGLHAALFSSSEENAYDRKTRLYLQPQGRRPDAAYLAAGKLRSQPGALSRHVFFRRP